MQRIQTRWLLISFVLTLGLGGCFDKDKSSVALKVPTVADYLHDLDSARAKLKEAQTDPVKAQTDQATINASAAVAKAMSPSMLQCWPKKPASSATTDHACLDSKGFVR